MNSICKTGKYTDYQKRSMGVRRRRTTDCSPIPASYAFERHRDHLEQLALPYILKSILTVFRFLRTYIARSRCLWSPQDPLLLSHIILWAKKQLYQAQNMVCSEKPLCSIHSILQINTQEDSWLHRAVRQINEELVLINLLNSLKSSVIRKWEFLGQLVLVFVVAIAVFF